VATTAALKALLLRSRQMLADLTLGSPNAQPTSSSDKWVAKLIRDIDAALK
jgi:hypothetical protein